MSVFRPPLEPSACRRLLVIKLSSLGDVIHALPTVHALKAAGAAAVDWVVQPEYAELAAACPDVDRVIAFPRRGGGRLNFLRELRRQRYDLAVDLQGLMKSAVIARLARARRRLGPSFHREGSRLFYSAVAGPRNRNRHAVDECLDALRALGWPEPEGPPVFPLRVPPYPDADARRPRIALCPRSRWPTKNWPLEHFVALGRILLARLGGAVHVFGGPADAEAGERIVAEIRDAGAAENHCGRTGLIELAARLGGMDLAITVDSGPMHLAAALGVPVLALFGPTDPVRTGPYGASHRVMRFDRLTCVPCFSERCARGDLACLRNVFPSAVAETAAEMLQNRRRRPEALAL